MKLQRSKAYSLLDQDDDKEENLFRNITGECQDCKKVIRIFWCHICKISDCWECFLKHNCLGEKNG